MYLEETVAELEHKVEQLRGMIGSLESRFERLECAVRGVGNVLAAGSERTVADGQGGNASGRGDGPGEVSKE